MRRKVFLIVTLLCLVGAAGLATDEDPVDETIWFGLGGSSIGVYIPDLAAVNAFLRDMGLGGFGDALLFTGGRGRGGSLGGLSLGAIGWGCEKESVSESRYGELAIGFGGLEVGLVVGGDERSLLTLGMVLGGGGSSLTLFETATTQCEDDSLPGPCGIIAEPLALSRHGAYFAVEPFVSLQAQPLHSFGFELHLGYLLPLFTFEWGDEELDGVSPRVGGPVVGFSATWGAIGRPAIGPMLDRPQVEETIEQAVLLSGRCIEINNMIGQLTVESSGGDSDADGEVRIVALKRSHSQTIVDQISVLIEPTRCGLTIHSKGPRSSYWEIEYVISVPAGIELIAKQAAGDVRLNNVSGTASIELGLGEIQITGLVGPSLTVNSGAGDIVVSGGDAATMDIVLGTGNVDIQLRDDASYEIDAETGIGEISVGPFVGLEKIEADGLACGVETTLGEGGELLSVHLGVGEIDIRPVSE